MRLAAFILTALAVPLIYAAGKPEDELVAAVKPFFAPTFTTEWQALEALPLIRWAPATSELKNCAPDGACYARQGAAVIGGRNLVVIATGARTIVRSLFLRNASASFGESDLITALKDAGLTADLVRCPIDTARGGTNWYRVQGAGAGFLQVQSPPPTPGKQTVGQGIVLSLGETIPALQPNQLRLYTDQCASTGAGRTPISTILPHEQLAKTLIAMLPPVNGPVLNSWTALAALPTGITWNPGGAKRADLSFKGDPNPFMHTGQANYSGREYSFLFSGSQTEVKVVYADQLGLQPPGEDLLGVLRSQRLTVQLVRCGPVYTESTNNWYRVAGTVTRPVMLKQSIRREGNQVQDAYEVRFDATLPTRDPRDREPGVNGCTAP